MHGNILHFWEDGKIAREEIRVIESRSMNQPDQEKMIQRGQWRNWANTKC